MPPTTTSTPGSTRRVGLFGGTFDPPHIGHILTGQRIAEARGLDEIRFVVANDPWQKSGGRNITPAAVRLTMVEQACYWSRHPQFSQQASDIELRAGGRSYTADTLSTLVATEPSNSYEVIVGSDAASQLHTWHRAEWLAENATFVSVQRGGQRAEPAPGFDVTVVDAPLLEVSSTDIRRRVRNDESIQHLCPQPVVALIAAHGLYREQDL